ncbi:hypothetical protein NLI96_g2758 [Meripilus lineatus]|uniref:Aspartate/glutamate/uridylate kinase domain-containing protein n=1 Tax=Meripilus lineatus TaxID=2056292 RepID=A0AAD5V7Q5_9APHY|nr:hypothetical protein NLI96_g2758 [Physisporinus lineatus]
MARPRHAPCNTIVIKLGTSSIVHEKTHQPLLSTLSGIVETVVHLRSLGHKVVLVSSGAIGVGLQRMNMPSRPKTLSGKQALAAIGQGRLIALWDNLFGQLGQPIAQVLLTRGDISDRTRYLNAVNTFKELLSLGVIPIVNENDTVSVSEIKFGDNDTLSAITASMLHADYLFLLTDVDGLYNTNPRKDPTAQVIPIVSSISAIRSKVSTKTLGSNLGTGGMETKLIAAEIATAAGVSTIIASSRDPRNILRIIQYNNAMKSGTSTPLDLDLEDATGSGRSSPGGGMIPQINVSQILESGASTPLVESSLSSSSSSSSDSMSSSTSTVTLTGASSGIQAVDRAGSGTGTPTRPPHTLFKPSPTPLRDLKAWTSHTLAPAGSVIVDGGAHRVLSKRESGGRLLPAGVVAVRGVFAAGQAVRILIRKGVPEQGGSGAGSSRESTPERGTEEVPTQPNTPDLIAIGSLSSSISTLDGMLGGRLMSLGTLPENEAVDDDVTPSVTTKALPEDDHVLIGKEEEGWEVEEVGRGLANYNSAQIERVKGLRSSYIAQVLGYADSEYVVENITIRVPP